MAVYFPKEIDERTHDYSIPNLSDLGKSQKDFVSHPYPICEDADGTLQEQLREELIKQLKERDYYELLMSKLDKQEYTMRKDQMFHRMQIEKNEKEYQDCLCYKEKSRARRAGQICAEQKFAAAFREMKNEEIRDAAFQKQLKICAPEVRELERQIRRSYYAKTLHAQMVEAESLKMEEKVRDHDSYEMMLEQLEKHDQKERDKIQSNFIKKKEYLSELKTQMEDLGSKLSAKNNDQEKDKIMVDQITALIKEEEEQDLQARIDKIQRYRNEIGQFLQLRNEVRTKELERELNEEERRHKYLEEKEAQALELKRLKEEKDNATASIVARAIERMMKAQFKQDEMEELRQELMEEEHKAELRQKELDDLAKKHKQMMELRAASENARMLREEKIRMEKKEEVDFRKQLMEKFAEDDRLELMGSQKRRQREMEHRKQIEKMIAERRCLRAQEKEEEQHTLDCFRMEDQRRQDIIDKERIRLLKLHGPNILGFIPRNVIKSQKELEMLGEPFLDYYRNPPLYPHPSTVDAEPCEEEIFKNMPVPTGIKY